MELDGPNWSSVQHRDTVLLFFQITALKADFYKEKCPLLLPFVRFVLNKATVGFDESQEGWEESWCKPLTGLCSVNGTEKKKTMWLLFSSENHANNFWAFFWLYFCEL